MDWATFGAIFSLSSGHPEFVDKIFKSRTKSLDTQKLNQIETTIFNAHLLFIQHIEHLNITIAT
jgi:hypothetical protein